MLGESGQVGLEFEVMLLYQISKCNCRGKSPPIEILTVKVYTKGNLTMNPNFTYNLDVL